MPYEPARIEPFWQNRWEVEKTFVATEDKTRPKFYALDMFPYPSGRGLHVGHPAGYTASDVVSRYKRARGFNVLHPMGYDAFGLPAEQRAIDEGVPPQKSTAESIENFRKQLKRLGFSYDWTREISTCEPDYYRWTQAIFTLLYDRGLAYQADTFVNWCPALGTVLANDEVIDGRSERGNHAVVRQSMRQWMLKITDYAEPLLSGLDGLDWPDPTKIRQKEWIGRSLGARINFHVQETDLSLEVFTTRPDTLFGATFLVVAPEHPIVAAITPADRRGEVERYVKESAGRSDLDRQQAQRKTGVHTGGFAKNPATGRAIPIWIADYVIYGYGTGAIMAVPGHDERDHAFAKTFGLPIVEVISGAENILAAAHAGEGVMMSSGPFDGTPTKDGQAAAVVTKWLAQEKLGSAAISYKLRDWTFARQRYWGEPIPVLKDGDHVVRVLGADELPLMLPPVESYKPLGTGQSPLAAVESWVSVDDPKTGRRLRRETDTMPGSAGSSWYFLRYCDPKNDRELCSREKSDYWMPVDLYVGGAEHTVGHLLYARMWQKVLKDAGLVRDAEPFQKLRHQGMILAFTYYDADKRIVPEIEVEERDGKFFRKGTSGELSARVEKMSKRKGNVVNPDEVIDRFGSDSMRVYICFMGPLESDKPWQTNGLEGQFAWLKRAYRLFFEGDDDRPRAEDIEPSAVELRVIHKAIKKVTEDIESLNLNTAISALHVATRDLLAEKTRAKKVLGWLAQLIQPFAPHFAEEAWRGLGHLGGISFAPWPEFDPTLAKDELVTIGVQVLGKTRGEIQVSAECSEADALAAARANPTIERHLEGKALTKVIYRPGKILNLIVR